MDDINFVESNGGKKSRRQKASAYDVEYTSGETVKAKFQKGETILTDQKKEKLPKKEQARKPHKSFLSWRNQKKKDPLISIHNAPKHHKEENLPDLLADIRQENQIVPESQKKYTKPQKQEKISPAPVAAAPAITPPPPITSAALNDTTSDSGTTLLGTNLLPKIKNYHHRSIHYLRDLIIIAVLALIAVFAVFAVLTYQKQNILVQIEQKNQEVNQLSQKIQALIPIKQEASVYGDQLQSLVELLNAHIYWTPLFSLLQNITLPTVYYSNMNGSAVSGKFVFDVVAKNYNQIHDQVELFRASPQVLAVDVTSATSSQDQDKVNFVMTVSFSPDLFHQTISQ